MVVKIFLPKAVQRGNNFLREKCNNVPPKETCWRTDYCGSIEKRKKAQQTARWDLNPLSIHLPDSKAGYNHCPPSLSYFSRSQIWFTKVDFYLKVWCDESFLKKFHKLSATQIFIFNFFCRPRFLLPRRLSSFCLDAQHFSSGQVTQKTGVGGDPGVRVGSSGLLIEFSTDPARGYEVKRIIISI